MNIVKASYRIEIPPPPNALELIERIGRTCYKSEDRITAGSAEKFVAMVIERGHESVIEHLGMSVRFIVDRGVSHELVRHRLASYSQESTRYCDYGDAGVTFIQPCFDGWDDGDQAEWEDGMAYAEKRYQALRARGKPPEQARGVLTTSLKTEVVMTQNLRTWRHVFRLRAVSKRAHPQMREVMCPLHAEASNLLPSVFHNLGVH
jgi:thymidylate synthase (FAD)